MNRMNHSGEPLTLGEDTPVINLTFIFLLLTLIATLIVRIVDESLDIQVVPYQKFTYTRKFGIFLIVLYLVSMVLNVLAACGILRIPYVQG